MYRQCHSPTRMPFLQGFISSFNSQSVFHKSYKQLSCNPPNRSRAILSYTKSSRVYHHTTITMSARPYNSPVEISRIHSLNPHQPKKDGSFVLYWMSNSVRTRHNAALEEAAALSTHLKKPLRVVFLFDIIAQDGQPLPERHAAFLLQGLIDVEKALKHRNIPFAILHPGIDIPHTIADISNQAAAVVTDTSYLRPGISTRKKVAKLIHVPLIAVEADVVVPVETVSNKAEHAARTLRPKITREMGEYLVPLEEVDLTCQQDDYKHVKNVEEWITETCEDVQIMNLSNIQSILQDMDGLDRGATEVTTFRGGQDAAQDVLKEFLDERFLEYGKGRNEPSRQLQSDLSPYLRAGNISPIDITLQTKTKTRGKSVFKESEASFLEELIVRRELAVNACWFNPERYDIYEEIVPTFAKESLELHRRDKRPKIYSYEELEAGVTNDPYWNAAQLEMVIRGKQHGYMRMYWVKQIIGWVADPKDAMDYAIRLNNRWELDAVDPNSYAGVIWCFGLHDQGWKEREIWGKVRYMNESGLKRKFNMGAYLAMVDRMVVKYGLPTHIAKLRKERGIGGVQKTIQETLKRSKSSSKKTDKKPTKKKASSSLKDTDGKSAAKEALMKSIKRLKT